MLRRVALVRTDVSVERSTYFIRVTRFSELGKMLAVTSNPHTLGKKRNVYRLLVGKPEGKRPLGRPRHRWIDKIKMDLLEIGLSVMDWVVLAQDRYSWRALLNSVMNLRVP
jgi:hypothetical protein